VLPRIDDSEIARRVIEVERFVGHAACHQRLMHRRGRPPHGIHINAPRWISGVRTEFQRVDAAGNEMTRAPGRLLNRVDTVLDTRKYAVETGQNLHTPGRPHDRLRPEFVQNAHR
jgi:hypothetical protein